jgi:hypothetical protein
LTQGASLRLSDGTMPRTVAEVIERATDDEATAELLAQGDRVAAAGLRLTYLDVHMGASKPAAYEAVARQLTLPFLYPGIPQSLEFTSIRMVSDRPAEVKREWMFARLEKVAAEPGIHLIVSHPAVDGPELASIARPDAANRVWADEYRISDLEVLCDPAVRKRVDELGIELTSVADAFAAHA